jgi:putative ABC transport system permease protein
VLSTSAVAVGIASVTVLIGAGVGAERALRAALEPLGENLLVVNPARRQTDVLRGGGGEGESLSVSDARAMRALAEARHIAPVAERQLLASADGVSVPAKVMGTTPSFEQVRNYPLLTGRFIDEEDLKAAERVVVIGALVVESKTSTAASCRMVRPSSSTEFPSASSAFTGRRALRRTGPTRTNC